MLKRLRKKEEMTDERRDGSKVFLLTLLPFLHSVKQAVCNVAGSSVLVSSIAHRQSEREKCAEIIEGSYTILTDALDTIARHGFPSAAALPLRFISTFLFVSSDQNSLILSPLPPPLPRFFSLALAIGFVLSTEQKRMVY